jgi:hypothetical protein
MREGKQLDHPRIEIENRMVNGLLLFRPFGYRTALRADAGQCHAVPAR